MKHILFVFCLAFGIVATASEQPNAIFVLRNSQLAPQALRAFETKVGEQACDCMISGEDLTTERLKKARVLFLEHPSVQFLDRLKVAALEAVKNGMRVVTDVPEIVQRAWGIELALPIAQRLMPYWQNGGEENMLGFFLVAYQEAGGPKDLAIPEVRIVPQTGVYHPDARQTFPNLTEYLAWYRKAKPNQGKLAVVTFFHTYLKNRDLVHIDALLHELENQGFAAAGVFGWPHHTLEKVFAIPPDDPLAVSLSFTLGLTKPEDHVFLEKQNVHVIGLMATRDSYQTWAHTDRGVTPERVATSLANPEMNGATDPIMVATTEQSSSGMSQTMPIEERVRMAARRAKRWVSLQEKPNSEKKLAILYYNNPPGKGNIGASYLNLAPSLRGVIETLQKDGYRTGDRIPDSTEILNQLEKVGRNIEMWAPGELNRMVHEGGVTLIPMERYRQQFNELPEQFRHSINDRWGPPEASELMVWKAADGKKFFVVPGVQLGNIFLGPQLLRASSAEYTNVQHSATLPPHHGYVAAYLHYRHDLGVDAVLHMGRHGTLEWLQGKNAGQAGWDASEVILGDLPNLNYYIMDGDGEAIQARRRSAAVDLSHLTPMLARTGREDRFKALAEAVAKWQETRETSPMLAKEYASTALAEIEKLGIKKQLSLDTSRIDESLNKTHEFLESVEESPIPLGLPTLGVPPSEDRQRAGLLAFLETAFQPDELKKINDSLPEWSAAIFEGRKPEVALEGPLREKIFRALDEGSSWLARLRASPDRELQVLLKKLQGEFLPSGIVGDPLAVPDALPSGRNLHQGDPTLIPTRAAWEVGKKLANQLLERHKQLHGRYPERISMILWQGETGRHQGAMEAQALYLMGIEPEWNARGAVDRLKLIPDAVLGRPRVNVVFTVSGLYRDGLADKIVMLDRAARMAAAAGDNAISRQNQEVAQTLIANGVAETEATELAGARVFTTAPGAYGFGLSNFVEQSRDKDEPQTMAQLYLSKMNYVYSEKTWGRTVPKLLENQLRGNETILHSRSSNLYGAVDNDDVYQWMGGLRVASEAAGAKPELLINNMRHAGREKLDDARKFIATELNARNWNPKWIAEMQKEGYSGAREMMKPVEYLYGWQATAPETIAPEVWKKMYDVYIADEYKLGLKEFFDQANPAAKQAIVGRLLEVDRQGTYRFTTAERRELLKDYVRLISKSGVACSANVCGNKKLIAHVIAEAKLLGNDQMSQRERTRVEQRFSEATQPQYVSKISKPSPSTASKIEHSDADPFRGWKVRIVKLRNYTESTGRRIVSHLEWTWSLWLTSGVFGGVIAYLRRSRRPQAQLLNLDRQI